MLNNAKINKRIPSRDAIWVHARKRWSKDEAKDVTVKSFVKFSKKIKSGILKYSVKQ